MIVSSEAANSESDRICTSVHPHFLSLSKCLTPPIFSHMPYGEQKEIHFLYSPDV